MNDTTPIDDREDEPVFTARDWLDDDDNNPDLLAEAVETEANYAYFEEVK